MLEGSRSLGKKGHRNSRPRRRDEFEQASPRSWIDCLVHFREKVAATCIRVTRQATNTAWILHGKDVIPDNCDFAVTSSLRPATRHPGSTTSLTQPHGIRSGQTNVSRHSQPMPPEWPPFHPNGFRRTRRRLVRLWISERLSTSTTSHRTHTHVNNLGLAHRISSSLHRDSALAILRRARLTASRDASTTLASLGES